MPGLLLRKVRTEFIVAEEEKIKYNISEENFDTISSCKYTVPAFLAIDKGYQRLILL